MTYFNREFHNEVSKGNVSGNKHINKYGRNDVVGTTEEDIWTVGGLKVLHTTAQSVEVISDNAADTNSAGAGARSVTVEGLDANFDEQQEDVNLNGTAAVALANTYIRIFRIFVKTSGAYASGSTSGTNTGTVDVQVASGGDIMARIEPDEGQSEMTHYTVPNGKTAVIRRIVVTVDTGRTADVMMHEREAADTVSAPFTARRTKRKWKGLPNGMHNDPIDTPVDIPGKTDIWFSGMVPSTAAAITIDYDLHITDD